MHEFYHHSIQDSRSRSCAAVLELGSVPLPVVTARIDRLHYRKRQRPLPGYGVSGLGVYGTNRSKSDEILATKSCTADPHSGNVYPMEGARVLILSGQFKVPRNLSGRDRNGRCAVSPDGSDENPLARSRQRLWFADRTCQLICSGIKNCRVRSVRRSRLICGSCVYRD